MLDQRRIILQYFYAYAAYCDFSSNHGICNGILNGFLHYMVSIAYLLIRFSLMILYPYEAIISLAFSEVSFRNRDVRVSQTFVHGQVPVHDTIPGQHWLEASFFLLAISASSLVNTVKLTLRC